jgi:hypothetical protein
MVVVRAVAHARSPLSSSQLAQRSEQSTHFTYCRRSGTALGNTQPLSVLRGLVRGPIPTRAAPRQRVNSVAGSAALPDGALARGLLRPRHSESLPGRGSIPKVARGQFRMSLDMARKAAATLQAIGDVVGLTREWARQISIDQCGGIIRSRPTSQVARFPAGKLGR